MTKALQEYNLDMDLNKMCRICLSQTDASGQLFNIFSSAIVDGFLVRIPEVISFCVDWQIEEMEGIPSKLCQICKGQLLNFYIFKQKCKRTELILQQTVFSRADCRRMDVASVCDQAQADTNPSNEISEEMIVLTDTKHKIGSENLTIRGAPQNQSQLCDKVQDLGQVELHTSEHNLTEEIAVCVDIDGKDEVSSDTKDFEPVTPMSEDGEIYFLESESVGTLNISDSVNNDYEAEENRFQSMQSEEALLAEKISCTICGKTVKGRARYLRHVHLHDASSNVTGFFTYHTCIVCSMMFTQKDQFIEHIQFSEHQQCDGPLLKDCELPYICGVCSVEHHSTDRMKQHLLSHLKSFPCPFEGCGCEYSSSARLSIHITNKHIEYESYMCRHCGSDDFDSMAELQQHLRLKCTEKKYQCSHCEKKFLTSRSLAQHLKCLEKKHHCLECGKAFAQPGELTLHQRTHNGERPFQCTVCGNRYRTASLRTAHMDSHIDGKTFECLLCGKKLQSRTCYRNHVRRHSEEKKHGCEICSKKFYTKYNVKVHREKVHKLIRKVENK
ncbi:zinc finger protein 699-like [Topomyia yanbarensis]|uniref:zinc finger protein 699-like n=1 Tax=Topomyia yanbarensis TaxID=2498891 RepID=UPI00273AE847|nr:zinc finger protein 699-like [Topomyia yanbarensis]